MNPKQSPVSAGNGMTVFKVAAAVSGTGLALMAVLLLWSVMGPREETPSDLARSGILSISEALAHYRVACHHLPTTEQGLQPLLTPPARGPLCAEVPSRILEKIPVDPWNHPYIYVSDGETFTLTSYGQDGKEGGEGADADIVFKGKP